LIYKGDEKMSWKKIALLGVALVVSGSMAMAQNKKVEFGVNFGYTLSEGVDVQPYVIPTVGTISKVNPTNAMSWGFNVDYLATENFSVGFLWDKQNNKLNADLQGGGKIDISDNNTYNYHGVFTYHLMEPDSPIRPYFFGGLGATHFSGGDLLTIPGAAASGTVGSETQFSTTWGGGVKFFPHKSIGLKVEMRWTPTYIKSDPAGIWCGGYWYGCWYLSDSDYSNQFKMAAGVVFRF